ncbi:MAG: hypothetical protein FWG05_06015 [Kiritimatiellaeota bacterium]|nr:hypothetical protein [Kiritimatiellota bacterium]
MPVAEPPLLTVIIPPLFTSVPVAKPLLNTVIIPPSLIVVLAANPPLITFMGLLAALAPLSITKPYAEPETSNARAYGARKPPWTASANVAAAAIRLQSSAFHIPPPKILSKIPRVLALGAASDADPDKNITSAAEMFHSAPGDVEAAIPPETYVPPPTTLLFPNTSPNTREIADTSSDDDNILLMFYTPEIS